MAGQECPSADSMEPMSLHNTQKSCASAPLAATAETANSIAPEEAAEGHMTKDELHSEIRYAIRLTERTARLYRKLQVTGYVLTILGGSAIVATVSKQVPGWLTTAGAILFAVTGALLIAIRPADKVAQNDADARKYQALMAKSVTMGETELEQALEEARQTGAPEIKPLRDVAFNDVAVECARPDYVVPLSPVQRVLAKLA